MCLVASIPDGPDPIIITLYWFLVFLLSKFSFKVFLFILLFFWEGGGGK
jgi:hypothetical protein